MGRGRGGLAHISFTGFERAVGGRRGRPGPVLGDDIDAEHPSSEAHAQLEHMRQLVAAGKLDEPLAQLRAGHKRLDDAPLLQQLRNDVVTHLHHQTAGRWDGAVRTCMDRLSMRDADEPSPKLVSASYDSGVHVTDPAAWATYEQTGQLPTLCGKSLGQADYDERQKARQSSSHALTRLMGERDVEVAVRPERPSVWSSPSVHGRSPCLACCVEAENQPAVAPAPTFVDDTEALTAETRAGIETVLDRALTAEDFPRPTADPLLPINLRGACESAYREQAVTALAAHQRRRGEEAMKRLLGDSYETVTAALSQTRNDPAVAPHMDPLWERFISDYLQPLHGQHQNDVPASSVGEEALVYYLRGRLPEDAAERLA